MLTFRELDEASTRVWAVTDASEEVPVVASLAKAYYPGAYFFVFAENVQIHGGVGSAEEHHAHPYLKRAKSTHMFLGDGTFHRERLLERTGI